MLPAHASTVAFRLRLPVPEWDACTHQHAVGPVPLHAVALVERVLGGLPAWEAGGGGVVASDCRPCPALFGDCVLI